MTIGRIMIVGAGATRARRCGYERAREIREIGAGIIVTANARRALRDLDVDAALEAMSSADPVYNNCDYRTAAVVQQIDNVEVSRKFGIRTLQVHRADLHGLLLDAVRRNAPGCLHAGHAFVSLDQTEGSVRAVFANGHTDEADALIGADGNASAVRSFLFAGMPTEFNGQVAFRALVPDELVPAPIRAIAMGMHRAPKRYLLHYPLRGGTVMNVIGCGQTDSWHEEGWSIPAHNEEFAAAYSDYSSAILHLIDSIPPGALFKWGLRDREPLSTWTRGRVAMLGDAAHPMTPFLGQGACLAIEDALVLGRAFGASESVAEALTRYEAARKARGNSVQLWSKEEGMTVQDPTRVRRTAVDRGLLYYDPVNVPV